MHQEKGPYGQNIMAKHFIEANHNIQALKCTGIKTIQLGGRGGIIINKLIKGKHFSGISLVLWPQQG